MILSVYLSAWQVASATVALVLITFYYISQWVLSTLRPKHYPPGPPVVPGLGNLLDIPLEKPYLKFQEWKAQYGDIVGLKTGAGNLVILNSPELVHEVFDKRGAQFSDRPEMPMFSRYVFHKPEETQILKLNYDDFYRRWRKSLNYILGPAGIQRAMPLLEAEACNFARKCLDGGKDFHDHMHYWVFATPIVTICGERLQNLPVDYAPKFFRVQEEMLKLLTPGSAPPIDVFPLLRLVPFTAWKERAMATRKIALADAETLFQSGLKQYRQIRDNPGAVSFECLLSKIMWEQSGQEKGEAFTDMDLGFLAQGVLGAATDTVMATFQSLCHALAAHPQVLARAQAEVDEVGGGRPPRGDELERLPYLRACIAEVLRWRPTTPAGLPHAAQSDAHVGGFFLPKGTTLLANAWAIHHDAAAYERPNEFAPERFLAHPLGLRAGADEPAGRRPNYAFGSGRRQCPGDHFATTEMLLAAAKLLWSYDILPPAGGIDVTLETGFLGGMVLQPRDQPLVFRLRGPDRESGLLGDWRRTNAIAQELLA